MWSRWRCSHRWSGRSSKRPRGHSERGGFERCSDQRLETQTLPEQAILTIKPYQPSTQSAFPVKRRMSDQMVRGWYLTKSSGGLSLIFIGGAAVALEPFPSPPSSVENCPYA